LRQISHQILEEFFEFFFALLQRSQIDRERFLSTQRFARTVCLIFLSCADVMSLDNINESAAPGERRPFPLDRETLDWVNGGSITSSGVSAHLRPS
jgi:hypothetical protein